MQNGETALHIACHEGHCHVVEYLVERAHCDTSEFMYIIILITITPPPKLQHITFHA